MTHRHTTWDALLDDLFVELRIEQGRAALPMVDALIRHKTAAPGESGAAATAAHLRGHTAMHLLTTESTPRGHQIIAALALAHLLEADTPDAEWRITDDGRLCGHVKHDRDRDARHAMRSFATFLGARLEADAGGNGAVGWMHLHIDATYRGAPVTVWTRVNVGPVKETQS